MQKTPMSLYCHKTGKIWVGPVKNMGNFTIGKEQNIVFWPVKSFVINAFTGVTFTALTGFFYLTQAIDLIQETSIYIIPG